MQPEDDFVKKLCLPGLIGMIIVGFLIGLSLKIDDLKKVGPRKN